MKLIYYASKRGQSSFFMKSILNVCLLIFKTSATIFYVIYLVVYGNKLKLKNVWLLSLTNMAAATNLNEIIFVKISDYCLNLHRWNVTKHQLDIYAFSFPNCFINR